MQKIFLVGNLTGDPQSRVTQSGKNVCSFTVAVNRRHRADGQPEADYFRVTAWEKLGENCQQYLAKGRKAAVTGTVSVSTYQGKDGKTYANLEVLANDVEFLSPKQDKPNGGYEEVTDDELPWGN